MCKTDALADMVPALLDRLTALKQLHIEAATFSSSLTHVSDEQKRISNDLQLAQELCQAVNMIKKKRAKPQKCFIGQFSCCAIKKSKLASKHLFSLWEGQSNQDRLLIPPPPQWHPTGCVYN